ncbi:putative nucleic acid-binding protein [Haloactinopolyspora alba]|uniref:Putative nucleic acid-binding protein n=1 Tax=Haloactinopolyspora alba TaxID=648780 RepID=A0A2P8E5K3_9ACTN|nr:hypothetical protein [Haloactinopolyspora alba]PSL04748.1 putative nucleic acid-binding protein [Haloactinopolyspora alba]
MTVDHQSAYVLDTGPLSHFARSQWLGVLKAILGDVQVLVPDVVAAELTNGCTQHVHLKAVIEAEWIDVVALDSPEQLAAFAYYEQRLVGPGRRNIGECGVLALAETMADAVAVVDDRVAVQVATKRGVTIRRTLGLLCEAIRKDLLTVPLVSAIADDLMKDKYRLPFGPGGFARWAEEQGLT